MHRRADRVRPWLAMVAMTCAIVGCGDKGSAGSTGLPGEELQVFSDMADKGSLVQACDELEVLCAEKSQACLAHEVFCGAAEGDAKASGVEPDPTAICSKLGQVCAGTSGACADSACQQEACAMFEAQCQEAEPGDPSPSEAPLVGEGQPPEKPTDECQLLSDVCDGTHPKCNGDQACLDKYCGLYQTKCQGA